MLCRIYVRSWWDRADLRSCASVHKCVSETLLVKKKLHLTLLECFTSLECLALLVCIVPVCHNLWLTVTLSFIDVSSVAKDTGCIQSFRHRAHISSVSLGAACPGQQDILTIKGTPLKCAVLIVVKFFMMYWLHFSQINKNVGREQ